MQHYLYTLCSFIVALDVCRSRSAIRKGNECRAHNIKSKNLIKALYSLILNCVTYLKTHLFEINLGLMVLCMLSKI